MLVAPWVRESCNFSSAVQGCMPLPHINWSSVNLRSQLQFISWSSRNWRSRNCKSRDMLCSVNFLISTLYFLTINELRSRNCKCESGHRPSFTNEFWAAIKLSSVPIGRRHGNVPSFAYIVMMSNGAQLNSIAVLNFILETGHKK